MYCIYFIAVGCTVFQINMLLCATKKYVCLLFVSEIKQMILVQEKKSVTETMSQLKVKKYIQ